MPSSTRRSPTMRRTTTSTSPPLYLGRTMARLLCPWRKGTEGGTTRRTANNEATGRCNIAHPKALRANIVYFALLMYIGRFYQNVPFLLLQKNIDFGNSNRILYCVSDCEE